MLLFSPPAYHLPSTSIILVYYTLLNKLQIAYCTILICNVNILVQFIYNLSLFKFRFLTFTIASYDLV